MSKQGRYGRRVEWRLTPHGKRILAMRRFVNAVFEEAGARGLRIMKQENVMPKLINRDFK